MKVAIVHELLTRRGGAERIARIFAEMYPDAPVYTLLYDQSKLSEWFPAERVQAAKLPAVYSLLPGHLRYNHHLYLRHFPAAVEAWDFREYDVVLSSSSAFAHGVITNGNPRHISYVHSPARYLWDATHDVLSRAGSGVLGPLKQHYLSRRFHPLRTWDAEAADRADVLLANSAEVQRRIQLYWRRDSQVVTPPIEDFWFASDTTGPRQDYALIVSTLAPYKQIDLAIAACEQLAIPLKIVGEGPDRRRLEQLADRQVEFLGYRSNEEVRNLYSQARVVLFPGVDDFGLVPVEAMACGAPVVARRAGGATETIVDGDSGLFFSEPTAQSLTTALQAAYDKTWSADTCKARASQYRRADFESSIRTAVSS